MRLADIEAAKEATLKNNHDTEDNIAQTTASGVKLTPEPFENRYPFPK